MKKKKASKKTEALSRHKCARCGKRRYSDRMTKIFDHPVLGKHPFWVCAPYKRHPGCVNEFVAEVLMYQETGLLQVIKPNIITNGSDNHKRKN